MLIGPSSETLRRTIASARFLAHLPGLPAPTAHGRRGPHDLAPPARAAGAGLPGARPRGDLRPARKPVPSASSARRAASTETWHGSSPRTGSRERCGRSTVRASTSRWRSSRGFDPRSAGACRSRSKPGAVSQSAHDAAHSGAEQREPRRPDVRAGRPARVPPRSRREQVSRAVRPGRPVASRPLGCAGRRAHRDAQLRHRRHAARGVVLSGRSTYDSGPALPVPLERSRRPLGEPPGRATPADAAPRAGRGNHSPSRDG